jgi:hypothetical protein
MASVLRQGTTKFTMRKEAERAALRAIRDAHDEASFSMEREELERARTIDEALTMFGWRVLRGDEGTIRGLRYEGTDYQGDEEGLFDALSPFVEPASVIEIWVENDTPKRFKFTGRTLVEKRIKPEEFRPFQEDDEQPPPSRIPIFKDVYQEAPKSRRAYGPNERFTPGEWIEHPKFGAGFVLKCADPGKVRVLFSDGERVLLQGK